VIEVVRRYAVWTLATVLAGLSLIDAQEPVRDLRIVVQQGEGNFNNIRKRLAQDISVLVLDQEGRPVEKAQVTFVLPAFGPSGTFAGGARSWKSETDTRGIARTEGLKPNGQEGRFNIAVTTSHQGLESTAVISQSNTMAGGIEGETHSRKLMWILAVAAGGATAAGLALRGGSNGSTPAQAIVPTTLNIGGVTVGAPR